VVDEATSNIASKWQVSGGVLQQKTNISSNTTDLLAKPGTYLLTGESTWTEYSVSVRMRTLVDDDGIGLMFGYGSTGNYYRFSMNRQLAQRQLVKFVNGVPTLLAKDGIAYVQSRWYTVEAKMIGGNVEIWVDGSRLFQVSDVSHATGKIALYSWGNLGVEFDDVAVNSNPSGGGGCTYSISPSTADVEAKGPRGA
jgi:hypothetical protein